MSAPLYGATPSDWDTFTLLLGLTTDLLPVVSNPHAEISPDSTMADLGKVPSHYNRGGKVVGIPGWPKHVASDQDIARWSKNPDYGICVITREVRAIDVDVPDSDHAIDIYDFILDHLGQWLPERTRHNSGKFLMGFTLPGGYSKRVIKVEGGIIEFLADGQQFIAIGTHPSGARYEWTGGLPDEFPTLTPEQFESLWSALVERFAIAPPAAERTPRAEGSAPAAPTDPVALATALDAIPNSGADELEYDDWLHVIMALHYETGASDDGLAMAHAFSARSSKYDPDEVELEWGRIKGASSAGQAVTGRSILHMARAHGWVEDVSGDFDVVVPAVAQGEKPTKPLPAFARKDKTGEITLTMDNMVKAIGRADMVGRSIGYDTFRDEIMYSKDEGENWASFKDADYSRLRIALERCGFPSPSKELTRDAVLLVADQNRFDSAQVWLGRLEWDGVPRVASFLPGYFATDDTPYTRAVSRYIWTALAGRVLEPGCQADMAPILVGPQGYLKSSGVAAMVPSRDFFAEISFGEKEDDLSRKMRGRLVAELAELKGLRGKDSEAIKAWMTKRYEDWTPKYREFNTVFPRRLLCVGTTNQDEFLVDVTGHRRWLPARINGPVDVASIKRDCAQLWAEARQMFTTGGVDFREAETLATQVHDEYMIRDAWEPHIKRWLAEPDAMTEVIPATREFLQVHEVLEGAIRKDAKNCVRADEMRIGDVLRALGYERKQKRVGGVREWVYFAPLA